MIGFIVLSCSLSISSMKLECNWIVEKTFPENNACEIFKKGYTLKSGEQLGICDEVEDTTKAGDKHPIIILKK